MINTYCLEEKTRKEIGTYICSYLQWLLIGILLKETYRILITPYNKKNIEKLSNKELEALVLNFSTPVKIRTVIDKYDLKGTLLLGEQIVFSNLDLKDNILDQENYSIIITAQPVKLMIQNIQELNSMGNLIDDIDKILENWEIYTIPEANQLNGKVIEESIEYHEQLNQIPQQAKENNNKTTVSHNGLTMIMSNSGKILNSSCCPLKFFGLRESNNPIDMQSLIEKLITNQVLPENPQDPQGNQLINHIIKESQIILVTLRDHSYEVNSTLTPEGNYRLTIKEITQQLNRKIDLHHNNQLITYLMDSLEEPLLIFNKNKLIEFANNKAKEMFGLEINQDQLSLKGFLAMLQETSGLQTTQDQELRNQLLFLINQTKYAIVTSIIGDFTCLLIQKIPGESILYKTALQVQEECSNNLNLISFLQNGPDAGALTKQVIRKITDNINIDLQKSKDYLGMEMGEYAIKSSESTGAFTELLHSIKKTIGNKEKIVLRNQEMPNEYLIPNNNLISRMVKWILEDLDIICDLINIDFAYLNDYNQMSIKIYIDYTSITMISYCNSLIESIINIYTPLLKQKKGSITMGQGENHYIQILMPVSNCAVSSVDLHHRT